ncbi:MAG: hypothetical protein PHQ28_14170 [Mycobacterium sp.]|nr:hypothetical protein [Mycobacterium sp.]
MPSTLRRSSPPGGEGAGRQRGLTDGAARSPGATIPVGQVQARSLNERRTAMQRWNSRAVILIGIFLLATTGARAQEKSDKTNDTNPGFEKLKQLAGEWVAADEPSTPAGEKKNEKKTDAPAPICIYRTVSAGTAVQETLFPGTPHEMVTMYHLDGADLVLTHYCALGNQPKMRAEKSADSSKLVFKFAGGTNIDPEKDAHMHDLTLTFVAPDRLRAEWTHYANGKSTGVKTFEMLRKK